MEISGRESFERFADALGGRRRRAESMMRSLKRMAAGGGSARHPFDLTVSLAEGANQQGAIVFSDAAAVADEAIADLAEAERELVQQNEALFEAELALDERNRHYQTLFELAPAAYVVTDAAGVIRELNQSASALLARPRNFAVGTPLALFVEAGAERTSFRTALDRLRETDDVGAWPLRLAPERRGVVDVLVSLRTVRDSSGAPASILFLLREHVPTVDDDLL